MGEGGGTIIGQVVMTLSLLSSRPGPRLSHFQGRQPTPLTSVSLIPFTRRGEKPIDDIWLIPRRCLVY